MKKSTLVVLVGFVLLAAATAFILNQKSEKGMSRLSFAEVNAGQISKLVLTGKNPVTLVKKDDTWRLDNGKEADSTAVQRLTEAISQIDSTDLVSSKSDKFAEMEVDEAKGTKVQAFAGEKVVAEFVVGKTATGGAYVRSGDNVYRVKKIYPYVFSKESSGWYKLKLFAAEQSEVAKVEVKPANGVAYALVKKEKDEWDIDDASLLPKGFRFDKAAARSLVTALVGAYAKEVVVEALGADKTGLDQGFDALSFVDAKGAAHVLRLGKSANNQGDIYAQVEGQSDVVVLRQYTAKSLKKALTDLRDLTVLTLDPEKVVRLDILNNGKRLALVKKGADWVLEKSDEAVAKDFVLDPGAVQRRLQALKNLKAAALSTEKDAGKLGLGTPSASVAATLDDGKKVNVVFGKESKHEDREVVYAKGNADNDTYLVFKGTLGSVAGLLSTFKKMPDNPMGGGMGGMGGMGGGMPNLDPNTLAKLPPEVRKNLQKQMAEKAQQQKMMEMIQSQMKKQEQDKAAAKP